MGEKQTKNKKINQDKNTYHHFFQKAPLPYQSLDKKGNFIDVNKKWQKILGYSKKEIIGKSFEKILDKKSKKDFKKFFQSFKSKGEIHNVELNIVTKSKEKILVSLNGKIEYDQNNDFIETHCILLNITDQKKIEDRLHFLSEIVKQSSDAIIRTDKNFKIVYVNSAAEKLWGYSSDELIGKTPDVFNSEEKSKDFQKKIYNKVSSGETYVGVHLNKKKDGSTFLCQMKVAPIKDKDGVVVGYTGFQSDVTKRKEAERRYKAFFENSPLLIVETDENAQVLSVNPAMAETLGKSAEELIGTVPDDCLDDSLFKKRRNVFKKVKKNKEPVTYEDFDPDRKTYFRTTIVPISYGGKETFLTIVDDISDQKKTENALKESETKFRSLVEQAAEMLFLHDTKGNIIDVNQAAEKNTGYSKKELLNMKIFDLDPFAKKRKDHKKYWKKLKPSDPSVTFETHHKKKNGEIYPAEVTLSKILIANKEYILALARDITERKKAEKELKTAQKRLKQMNLHLEKKVKERTAELSSVNRQLKKEIEERKNAEEKYRSLFEASPELIGEFDEDGRVVSINPAMAESLNVFPDDAIGKKISVFSDDDVMEERIKKANQVLDKNKMMDFEDRRKNRFFHNIYVPVVHSDGSRTVQLIAKDITERKKAEIENIRNMKYLENVIDSASEIIMACDEEHRVSLWNKAAEKLTGYKRKKVLGKKVESLEVFEKAVDLKENISQVCKGKKLVLKNTFIKPKKGNNRIIRFAASPIKKTQKEGLNSCLFIGTDVTVDSEYHGRVLKGCSYMVSGESFKPAFELFKTLTFSDYSGIYITRGEVGKNTLKNQLKNTKFLYLKNKSKGNKDTISDLEDLINKIKSFCKKNDNCVVFLDRVDYLLTIFSFEKLIKKLYLVNDVISETNSILVVYFDPKIFTEQQIAFVGNEFKDLPGQKIDDVDISNELYNILEFIYKKNENRVLISFKDVGKKFSIVSKTTSKRIDKLVEKGLIYIKKEGRRKTLHVSEKGDQLIDKRKTT